MLTRLLRQVMDILEKDPAYHSFLLDGQTVPVEDYLSIYPEEEERIRKLVKSGKLQIGPWYTLPDQMPLDGECLIRNLFWGMRLSASTSPRSCLPLSTSRASRARCRTSPPFSVSAAGASRGIPHAGTTRPCDARSSPPPDAVCPNWQPDRQSRRTR